jgi:hypothetical protein
MINAVSNLWAFVSSNKHVQEAAGSFIDNFLPNAEADEQLFNAAFNISPMTPELREKLLRRLCRLPTDQQDRFRIITAQVKVEDKNRKEASVEATAKVLAAIAEYDDEVWEMYVDNMNLRNPLPANQFILIVKNSRTPVQQWLALQKIRHARWVRREFVPTVNRQTQAVRNETRRGFSWDPANRRWW